MFAFPILKFVPSFSSNKIMSIIMLLTVLILSLLLSFYKIDGLVEGLTENKDLTENKGLDKCLDKCLSETKGLSESEIQTIINKDAPQNAINLAETKTEPKTVAEISKILGSSSAIQDMLNKKTVTR
jgi:hypothetical protein